MEPLWLVFAKLLAVGALVFANGFFVAVEFALVSVRRAKIEALAAQGDVSAQLVRRLLEQTDKMLAAAQLGITMASLALGWIGENTFVELIRPLFAFLPGAAAGAASHALATTLAFALLTLLLLVLGEQAPKIYSIRHPEKIAFLTVRPILAFELLFRPFIWLIDRTSQLALQAVGIERRLTEPGRLRSLEELRQQFVEVYQHGLLGRQQEEMLHHVIEFTEQEVREVMIPRPEVVSIEENATIADLLDLFREANYTRYPVYREKRENIVGYVSIKDALRAISGDPNALKRPVKQFMHPMKYVPENKSVSTLFAQMQRERAPMVAVVNEYSDTVGIVTLKDLAEEIVGQLEDEPTMKEEPLFERVDEQTIRVDGHLRIDEANEELGLSLPERDEYQTIAGFILYELERVPSEGETLRYNNVQITVEKMKGPRIEKVLIRGV
jgi:CBS domain containing-hemolysin-like protein